MRTRLLATLRLLRGLLSGTPTSASVLGRLYRLYGTPTLLYGTPTYAAAAERDTRLLRGTPTYGLPCGTPTFGVLCRLCGTPTFGALLPGTLTYLLYLLYATLTYCQLLLCRTLICSQLLLCVLCGTLTCASVLAQDNSASDSFRFSGIGRVVAIADVHGALEPFIKLLRGTALVDESLRWQGGDSHLVIVGDVLDRGNASRQVMDLLQRLEQEAAAAGGAVHMVLGNHEIMNLSGELGYVTRDDFSAYRDLEPASVRRGAMSRFAEQSAGVRPAQVRTAFDRRYPRGYFGHREAFAPDGVYGKWLLEKPLLLVINDIAFVHAGLPARLLEQGEEALNEQGHAALLRYLDAAQVLLEAEVFLPETEFQSQASLARRYLESPRARNNDLAREAAEVLVATAAQDPFDHDSPVWYRGMVDCSPALEQGRLQRALATLRVSHLVIGHTPTRNRLLQQRFDNSLLMADTGMLNSYFGGQPAALVFEGENLSVFYADGASNAQPSPTPRLVGARPGGIDDDALASLLSGAASISAAAQDDGSYQITVPYADSTFNAIFRPATNGAFMPEVAAYRLDRLLGMELLPVAVPYELQGQSGALYVDQGTLPQAPGNSDEPWCPVPDQQALAGMFDYLLNVPDRTPDQQRYTDGNWKLVLLPGQDMFGTGSSPALPAATAAIASPYLRERLAALTAEQLERELGTVLDAPRREALLQRRDQLLDQLSPGSASR